MKNQKFMTISMVLLVSFLLVACQDKKEGVNETPSASVGTEASNLNQVTPKTGELAYKEAMNIAITAQPPTLDPPFTVSNVTFVVAGNIYEQLVTLNDIYEPVPELAASIEVSDDALVYTFTLRENILFHNGEIMTAEDVVASMNRWLTTSSRAKNLLAGALFEVVDESTVICTVKEATSDVLLVMASRSQFPAIMPKEIVDNAPAEGISEHIGTGPYELVEWKQDQYIHLTRFDGYQSLDSPSSGFSGKKEAFTKDLYFHFVTDHATRIAGVQTGEYDVAENIPIENYPTLSADDTMTTYMKPGGIMVGYFNTTQGPFADAKLREAILTAIDCESVMYVSYGNEENFFLNHNYMNVAMPQWQNDGGKEFYNQANQEKAKELLAASDYNGETIRLLTTKDYNEMYTAIVTIHEQLRQIGVNCEVVNSDFPTFLETKNDRTKWDFLIATSGYGMTPPQILATNPEWSGFDVPELHDGLSDIRGASTAEGASEAWEKLQTFIYEYPSSTIIGHYNSLMASTSKAEGVVFFDQSIYWNARVAE